MLSEERRIFFIHNNPKLGGASLADLSSATWLDAEWLLVVNPDGKVHRHQKVGGGLVELEPWNFPEFVAPVNPVETVLHSIAYWMQTAREIGNPPEAIFKQGETAEDEITVDTGSRLVSEFLLNPAAIVFLDDVAKEYGVEDTALFSAMVPTIIYRELQDRLGFGLPNADHPAYQSNWDVFKFLINHYLNWLPFIDSIDGDPSFGIGALNRQALSRIEQDARRLNMRVYAPLLGYDIAETLHHVPFSEGTHKRTAQSARTVHVLNLEHHHKDYVTTVIPPSNEKHGAWRMQLAEFSGPDGESIQQLYEPTLGLIAAEVAIAIQSPLYQELQTEEDRIRFLIANHANRSAIPDKSLFSGKLTSDNHREIRWLRDFEKLIHEVNRRIQTRA